MKYHILLFLLILSAFSSSAEIIRNFRTMPEQSCFGITSSQVDAMEKQIPENNTGFGPNYKDRQYWTGYPISELIRQQAERCLSTPMPSLSDHDWLATKGRGHQINMEAFAELARKKKMIFCNLAACVIMECKENQGRFMPRIEEVIRLWLGTNGYLDSRYDPFGRSISGDLRGIDLGVAQYFTDLATAYYLLDDKLSPAIRKQMQDRTDEWVFSPLFRAYAARDKKEILKFSPVMWWLDGENNWNPYCHTRCVVMAMTMLTSRRERAYVMAHAIKLTQNYLKSFTPEGYITEGIGYWMMGFQSYVDFSMTISYFTNGQVDMIAGYENAANASGLGYYAEMVPGARLYAHFADFGTEGKATFFGQKALWKLNQASGINYYGDVFRKKKPMYANGVSLYGDWFSTYFFKNLRNRDLKSPPVRRQEFFVPSAGVLISRDLPEHKIPLSFAIKGGHNGELHNHNDLGSYVIGVGNQIECGDPGYPSYPAATRSLVMSSLSHPVPLINETEQGTGKKFYTKVLHTLFTTERAEISYDLKPAYPPCGIKKLIRTAIHDRQNEQIIITDEFELEKNGKFAASLITYRPITDKEKNRFQIGRLSAELQSDCPLIYRREIMPVIMQTPARPEKITYSTQAANGRIKIIFKKDVTTGP